MNIKNSSHLPEPLLEIVQALEAFSKKSFPIYDVGIFFQDISISDDTLRPYIFFQNDYYTRNLIYKTSAFEILLLCWGPGHKSRIHGHEGEKCWMRVEQGNLVFTNYQEISFGEIEQLSVVTGDVGFTDGPAIIHKVENLSDEKAISLHLYARPFKQCDIFDQELNKKKKVQLTYYTAYGRLID